MIALSQCPIGLKRSHSRALDPVDVKREHSNSAVSGSRSTTFLPPKDIILDICDFSLFRGLASDLCLCNRRCVHDDGVISNQTIVYRRYL